MGRRPALVLRRTAVRQPRPRPVAPLPRYFGHRRRGLQIYSWTSDQYSQYATEMIFGAYDLLGLRFAPRIRDLDRQRLYRHGTPPAVDTAGLLRHKIRPELILPYWDELLRLAASLRHG